MTKNELLQTIADIENGLAMNPTGEILERLASRLKRAQNQLDELDQKKSEAPKQVQHPPLQETNWERQVQTQHADQVQSVQAFAGQALVESVQIVATLTPSPSVTVPAVEITLKNANKEHGIEKVVLTQAGIMRRLKNIFKPLANSVTWQEGRYTEGKAGNMGYNVNELFKGWNAIYKITKEAQAWPPLEDVYPAFKHATQAHKVGAEVLWRWASGDESGMG